MNIFFLQPFIEKAAFVTGGGSGIGPRLDDEGAAVFISKPRPEIAADTLNAAPGGKSQAVACHIFDTESVHAFAGFRRLLVLVWLEVELGQSMPISHVVTNKASSVRGRSFGLHYKDGNQYQRIVFGNNLGIEFREFPFQADCSAAE